MHNHAPASTAVNPALALWRRMASAFVSELLALPEDQREGFLCDLAQKESLAVYRALSEESRASLMTDSSRAITLARYALLAAELMTNPALLVPEAYCHLALAFRLAGRLEEAEETLAQAAAAIAALPDDLKERAAYLELLSLLRRDQGRFDEAEDLKHQAGILREALGGQESLS